MRRGRAGERPDIGFAERNELKTVSSELCKRLRTCAQSEREGVAIQSARSGGQDAVAELIRMVEAKKRSLFSRYDYEDQLTGVKALGETRSREALNYLQGLYTPTKDVPVAAASQTSRREAGRAFIVTHEKVGADYPNAKDELRRRLSHEIDIYYDIEYGGELRMPSRRKSRESDNKDAQVHGVVQSAIRKLKASLGAQ